MKRCGELLKEIEKAQGGDRKSINFKKGDTSPFDSPRKQAALEAGKIVEAHSEPQQKAEGGWVSL